MVEVKKINRNLKYTMAPTRYMYLVLIHKTRYLQTTMVSLQTFLHPPLVMLASPLLTTGDRWSSVY